jgi:hypothetical protein
MEHAVAAYDMGMLAQAHPGRAFLQEAVAGGAVGQVLRLEGLERDGALLLMVEAQVDDAHAAQEGCAGHFVAAGDAGAGGVEWHEGLLLFKWRLALASRQAPAFTYQGAGASRRWRRPKTQSRPYRLSTVI